MREVRELDAFQMAVRYWPEWALDSNSRNKKWFAKSLSINWYLIPKISRTQMKMINLWILAVHENIDYVPSDSNQDQCMSNSGRLIVSWWVDDTSKKKQRAVLCSAAHVFFEIQLTARRLELVQSIWYRYPYFLCDISVFFDSTKQTFSSHSMKSYYICICLNVCTLIGQDCFNIGFSATFLKNYYQMNKKTKEKQNVFSFQGYFSSLEEWQLNTFNVLLRCI